MPISEAEAAQSGHGGWSSDMKDCFGKVGTVVGVDSDGDVRVDVPGIGRYVWNPSLLDRSSKASEVSISDDGIKEGSRVTLPAGVSSQGVLSSGDVGEVIEDDGSDVPYKVKALTGSRKDDTHWYSKGMLILAGGEEITTQLSLVEVINSMLSVICLLFTYICENFT